MSNYSRIVYELGGTHRFWAESHTVRVEDRALRAVNIETGEEKLLSQATAYAVTHDVNLPVSVQNNIHEEPEATP